MLTLDMGHSVSQDHPIASAETIVTKKRHSPRTRVHPSRSTCQLHPARGASSSFHALIAAEVHNFLVGLLEREWMDNFGGMRMLRILARGLDEIVAPSTQSPGRESHACNTLWQSRQSRVCAPRVQGGGPAKGRVAVQASQLRAAERLPLACAVPLGAVPGCYMFRAKRARCQLRTS